MAKMQKLTEMEIRAAIHASDDDDDDDYAVTANEVVLDDMEDLASSDSEEDICETASEMDDEICLSECEEVEASAKFFVGKDGTEWSELPVLVGKTPAHNIMRGSFNKVFLPPGKHIESPADAFSLFFDNEVLKIIVQCTNINATEHMQEKWKPTDEVEMRAYIGLLIDAGVRKNGISDYKEFWDPLYGNSLFRACMSKTRFTLLSRYLRFDEKVTRNRRRAEDKFAAIRDVWDRIMKNFKKVYIPGVNLTIDEQLVPFRGRVSFRQYMPAKPDKYGMKIWWICDSKTSYPLYGIPYLGKEGPSRQTNLAQNVVKQLCAFYENTNRNITFDNFFTSFDLLLDLLSKRLTCVGTLRKNKACIPTNFLPSRQREVGSTVFGFQKYMTLVSFVPKKNKAVLLLSSMHHTADIDEESKKPEINLYYNSTKGGVDTLDQLCHAFTCKRKTRRWPVAHFYNLIDAAGVASKVIWLSLYPKWNDSKTNIRRKIFLKDLSRELIMSNIQRRSLNRLSSSNVTAINEALSTSSLPNSCLPPPCKKIHRRCHLCPYKKCRVSMQLCQICTKNVCNEHSQKAIICHKCVQNN